MHITQIANGKTNVNNVLYSLYTNSRLENPIKLMRKTVVKKSNQTCDKKCTEARV
jgi:hypothetical protein